MLAIIRAELVWVSITNGTAAAGGRFQFRDQPDLNGVYILGVEAFDDSLLAFTPDLLAVLPGADVPNVLLTLNEGSDERIKQVPFASLIASANGGIWKEFEPFIVNWQKSEVQLVASLSTDVVQVPFVFYYARPEDLQALGITPVTPQG